MKKVLTSLSLCLLIQFSFAGNAYAQQSPVEPQPMSCDRMHDLLDFFNDVLDNRCNGGVGPFEPGSVGSCLRAIELRDFYIDLIAQYCTV